MFPKTGSFSGTVPGVKALGITLFPLLRPKMLWPSCQNLWLMLQAFQQAYSRVPSKSTRGCWRLHEGFQIPHFWQHNVQTMPWNVWRVPMASLTFENTNEPQILPLSALELWAFCIIWSCCQTRLGKVLFLQYIILRPLISLTTEKPSHLKSDKDFYATSKLVGLAVHPQPDPYFMQAPRAFPPGFVFPGKKTGTPGLQDNHSILCLDPWFG